jgi:hypothetical protein
VSKLNGDFFALAPGGLPMANSIRCFSLSILLSFLAFSVKSRREFISPLFDSIGSRMIGV